MLVHDVHRWLGEASGGTGPVFRWVWASLVAASVIGMVWLVHLAFRWR
jgi:hypothetical protein